MITISLVLSWNPCKKYTKEYLTELFDGREYVTATDVINSNIPPEDKIWVLLRNVFFSDEELHLMACDFVEFLLPIWERHSKGDVLYNNAPAWAIEVKRRWVRGEASDEELEVVRKMAWETAKTAAIKATSTMGSVARAVAWATAGAARAATWAAVNESAGKIARAVTRAATNETMSEDQLQIIKIYLEKKDKTTIPHCGIRNLKT